MKTRQATRMLLNLEESTSTKNDVKLEDYDDQDMVSESHCSSHNVNIISLVYLDENESEPKITCTSWSAIEDIQLDMKSQDFEKQAKLTAKLRGWITRVLKKELKHSQKQDLNTNAVLTESNNVYDFIVDGQFYNMVVHILSDKYEHRFYANVEENLTIRTESGDRETLEDYLRRVAPVNLLLRNKNSNGNSA